MSKKKALNIALVILSALLMAVKSLDGSQTAEEQ